MEIRFLSPWWWLLALLLPVIIWTSRRSLAGLGPIRKWIAIGLRTFVMLLLICCLADIQWVRRSETHCNLFVLDHSQSIPTAASEQALAMINASMNNRRKAKDIAGVVAFGKEARIELPPYAYPLGHSMLAIQSTLDRQYSDVSAGIKLAVGSFPPDCTKRMILISDGNQNRGDAISQAMSAKQAGIPIDVIPIEYKYDSEVLIDKIVLPSELKPGDTANMKIVLRTARACGGKLRVQRLGNNEAKTLLEERVELQAGLNVLTRQMTIDEPDFYNYEARFEPDKDAGDVLARNNQAAGFTLIRGKGRVLLIEPSEGKYSFFASQLRKEKIDVVAKTPTALRDNLAELRQYDAVILANVPAEMIGEPVQETLATACRELGIGLLMTGGVDSFGAGGYIKTPIEKAMPVNMTIQGSKVRGKGALVMIMHASEIPEGNYWQKRVAKLAIERLSPTDECGTLYWDGKDSWLFPLQEVGDGAMMNRRIDRMAPGDMPDFAPTMQTGLNSLLKTSAVTKHMIIISDGDPQPPPQSLLQKFKDAKVSISTVAVAAHGSTERTVMRNIANQTNGRYYEATNPRALPGIYIKETRVVTRPLIFEQADGWSPLVYTPTELVAGMPKTFPPIKGFVLTTPKQTAEVALLSPIPKENAVNPILAHWQYGIGRAVAFTSDLGESWTTSWTGQEMYAKFWSQVVRWAMRPGESEYLNVATQEKDGKVRIVVNALDANNELINFLNLKGKAIRPDMSGQDIEFRQTEPGKYEASVDTEQAGSYMIRLGYRDSTGRDVIASTGLTVSYPPEFRDTQSNRDILETIASITGGKVMTMDEANKTDFYKTEQLPNLNLNHAWPIVLLIALCSFFFDVAVRRIAIEPHEVQAFATKVWKKIIGQRHVETPAVVERLRSRKSEVGQQIEEKKARRDLASLYGNRELATQPGEQSQAAESKTQTGSETTSGAAPASARFELDPNAESAGPLDMVSATDDPGQPRSSKKDDPKQPGLAPDKPADEAGYTSRLLKAKKKTWDQDKPS